MLHIVLALYILAGSLGVGAIFLILFSYLHWRHRYLWRFVLFVVAITMLLQAEGLKTYEQAVSEPPTGVLAILVALMTTVGTGLLAWALPAFVFRATHRENTPFLIALKICTAVAYAALGAAKQLWGGAVWTGIHYAALYAVYVYASLLVLINWKTVHSAEVRILLRFFLILNAALALPGIAQFVLQRLPSWPRAPPCPAARV